MRKAMFGGALVIAASLFAISANATSADAAPSAGKAVYTDETIQVYEAGTPKAPYQFYTTAKVTATSIPKNDKWTKFDGTLDLSSYPKATKFYFSMSPNPSSWTEVLEVSVPAQPSLTGLKYAATGTDAAAMLIGSNAQVFNSSKDKTKVSDAGLLSADKATLQDIYDGTITQYQATGTTLSVVYTNKGALAYNSAAAETTVKDKTGQEVGTGHYAITLNGEEGKGTYLRPSKPCNLKIAKAAAAPAVTIDYANATMTLKNTMQYLYDANGSYDDLKRETATGWTPYSTEKPKVSLKQGVYAVATGTGKARSQLTYISVPEPKAFTAANGQVTVVGSKLEASNKNKKAIVTFGNGKDTMTYQYRIVDNAADWFNAAGEYDSLTYDTKIAAEAKKKAQIWTNVKVTAGYKSVTFSNTVHADKDILVRVAAGTNTFASQIMVLEQPETDGDGWKSYAQGDSTNATTGITFGTPAYDAKTGVITIPAAGIGIGTLDAATKEKCTVKYGKKTASATDVDVAASKITLKLPASDDFQAINNKSVVVTIPEGLITDSKGNNLPDQTFTVMVDNVAPKATAIKAAQASGTTTITVTVDSPLKAQVTTTEGEGDDAVESTKPVNATSQNVAIDISNITLAKVSKEGTSTPITPDTVKFKLASGKTTITITTPTTTIADMIASYTVTLANTVTDVIGNPVDMNGKGSVANPKYNAAATAANVTAEAGGITGGVSTVTVKTADAATFAITAADYQTALQEANKDVEGITISDVKLATTKKSFTFKVSGLTNEDTTEKAVSLTLPTFKDSNGFDITPTLDPIKIPGKPGTPEEP